MNIKPLSKTSILISLLLLIIMSACSFFGWVTPVLDWVFTKETQESSPGGNLPDDQAGAFDPFTEGKAFQFKWNEIAEGGGIHFDGTFLGCSNYVSRTTVSIYGDLGRGIELSQGGINWEDMILPNLDGQVRTHITWVDLEGTIKDPNCQCKIKQRIQLVFEFDFEAGNVWIKDATGHGEQTGCQCPGLGAAVPLIEFWFPRDLLLDLQYIDEADTDCDMYSGKDPP